MTQAFSDETIAAAKARYQRLKASGQDAAAFDTRVANTPATPKDVSGRTRLTETVPGGWYWHGVLAKGEVLRVSSAAPASGVALLLWNAHDTSERVNPADTVKIQWTAHVGKGRVLLSDMGRAIASILSAPAGTLDCVCGASTPWSNRQKYGEDGHFNAHDHFIKAASKHGLGKRDVGPCVHLFSPLRTDGEGGLHWDDGAAGGGHVDLRAEMTVIAALANCPHPLSPGASYAPQPITVEIWQGDPPADDDLCRTGTDEARRAFINTAAWVQP
ncbi:MAG: urea amidolyase associated protein UAAP1 [Pseudomonadota bacterium]